MARLVSYPWPGNIRELQNVIERGVVLSKHPILSLDADLLPLSEPNGSSFVHSPLMFERDTLATLGEVERSHILTVLNKTDWIISGPNGAAAILDLHPNTLRSRMKKLGIQR